MKRFVLALLCLLFMSFSARADVSFSQAEEHYKRSEYQQSLDLYKRMYQESPRSADLLYNMGNVYYQMGEIGEAMVFYLRAKHYMPRNNDLKANLELAQERVVDDVQNAFFLTAFLASFLDIFSVNEWYGIWVFGSAIFAGFLMLKRYVGLTEKQRLARNVSLVVFVLLSASLGLKLSAIDTATNAVVVSRKVEAKSGPSDTLKTKFFVHEGARIHLLKILNGWSEVQLRNGFRGWVPQDSYWTI